MPSLEPVQTWEEPVREFLLHYEATRSANTRKYYAARLRTLSEWAAAEGIAFGEFSRRHLDRYVISRQREGRKPTTVQHCAAAACTFFSWCARNDLLERDPLYGVRVRNAPLPPRRVIAQEDVARLLAALDTYWDPRRNPNARFMTPAARSFHKVRNAAALKLALVTAARVGEVLAARLDDWVPSERRLLLRETKGGEAREVPVSAECADALAAWLRKRRTVMGGRDDDPGTIFVSETGGTVDPNKFLRLIGPISEFAGCSVRLQMHDLRRYALTAYSLDNPHVAAKIAGHRDFRTTQRYAAVSVRDTAALVDRADLLGKVTYSKRDRRKRLV
jgi:site-specific recombinase XerD